TLLVLSGAIALIYLAVSVVQVIQSPQESEWVQWITSTVENSDLVLSGHFNENEFQLHATAAFQYLFLSIIGLAMLSLITTVVNALISGGIQLIRFANHESSDTDTGKKLKH
ncbi:MAG: hypothetical protein P8101_12975, partial [Candidatus Thiodiazotropha sp.]